MPAKKSASKPAASKAAGETAKTDASGWTAEERAAMRERAKEMKAEARRGSGDEKAEGTREVLAKVNAMAEPDRAMAKRLHALVTETAPDLVPRLWYGMPAYSKGGKVLCYFQDAKKFKTRYATFGFSDKATLDDGLMWPVAFALKTWDGAVEAQIVALVKRATR